MNNIEILEELKEKYITSGLYQIGTFELTEEEKQAIENLIQENKQLKERLKKVKKYIESEMDIVDNPTICGDEEDTIIELPISLCLYNEDLRKLLELLEEGE